MSAAAPCGHPRAPAPPLRELDAVILAGGESRRMGRPKASLPWPAGTGYPSTVIGAVVSALLPLFRRTLVVARNPAVLEGLGLDGLRADVLTDDCDARGPLVGLARGLTASSAPWCFLVGCDMPFLRPEVIRRMAAGLHGCDAVAADIGGRLQPLHAFYSRWCLPAAEELLATGDTSLNGLLSRLQVKHVPGTELAIVDPELESFRDLDTWAEYRNALVSSDN